MSEWQPIETAPRDGSWFVIYIPHGGDGSFEVGCFEPLMHEVYVPAEKDLYRKERQSIFDWTGFNNMHAATHWMPLPEPPS